MVDRAAIFAELTKRNAVRREAKLPLLDIRSEFIHAVGVATWREACEKHAVDMARIEQEVLAEFRDRRGADFPQSLGGRWMVNFEVSKRFLALLADDGVHPPTPHHRIVYGSDREAAGT